MTADKHRLSEHNKCHHGQRERFKRHELHVRVFGNVNTFHIPLQPQLKHFKNTNKTRVNGLFWFNSIASTWLYGLKVHINTFRRLEGDASYRPHLCDTYT